MSASLDTVILDVFPDGAALVHAAWCVTLWLAAPIAIGLVLRGRVPELERRAGRIALLGAPLVPVLALVAHGHGRALFPHWASARGTTRVITLEEARASGAGEREARVIEGRALERAEGPNSVARAHDGPAHPGPGTVSRGDSRAEHSGANRALAGASRTADSRDADPRDASGHRRAALQPPGRRSGFATATRSSGTGRTGSSPADVPPAPRTEEARGMRGPASPGPRPPTDAPDTTARAPGAPETADAELGDAALPGKAAAAGHGAGAVLLALLVIACAAVSAVGVSRLLAAHWGLRRLQRGWRPVARETRERAYAIGRRMRYRRRFRVLGSRQLGEAAASGWLRPVVALPFRWLRHLPGAQLDPLLIHEVAHLRTRDPLWRTISWFTSALLWIHPLAHRLARREEFLSEELADRAVLADGVRPRGYAALLGELAELRLPSTPALAVATGTLGTRNHFEGRIRMILDSRTAPPPARSAPGWSRWALAGLFAVSLGLVVAHPIVGAAGDEASQIPVLLLVRDGWWVAEGHAPGDGGKVIWSVRLAPAEKNREVQLTRTGAGATVRVDGRVLNLDAETGLALPAPGARRAAASASAEVKDLRAALDATRAELAAANRRIAELTLRTSGVAEVVVNRNEYERRVRLAEVRLEAARRHLVTRRDELAELEALYAADTVSRGDMREAQRALDQARVLAEERELQLQEAAEKLEAARRIHAEHAAADALEDSRRATERTDVLASEAFAADTARERVQAEYTEALRAAERAARAGDHAAADAEMAQLGMLIDQRNAEQQRALQELHLRAEHALSSLDRSFTTDLTEAQSELSALVAALERTRGGLPEAQRDAIADRLAERLACLEEGVTQRNDELAVLSERLCEDYDRLAERYAESVEEIDEQTDVESESAQEDLERSFEALERKHEREQQEFEDLLDRLDRGDGDTVASDERERRIFELQRGRQEREKQLRERAAALEREHSARQRAYLQLRRALERSCQEQERDAERAVQALQRGLEQRERRYERAVQRIAERIERLLQRLRRDREDGAGGEAEGESSRAPATPLEPTPVDPLRSPQPAGAPVVLFDPAQPLPAAPDAVAPRTPPGLPGLSPRAVGATGPLTPAPLTAGRLGLGPAPTTSTAPAGVPGPATTARLSIPGVPGVTDVEEVSELDREIQRLRAEIAELKKAARAAVRRVREAPAAEASPAAGATSAPIRKKPQRPRASGPVRSAPPVRTEAKASSGSTRERE